MMANDAKVVGFIPHLHLRAELRVLVQSIQYKKTNTGRTPL